jgi:hypothetical protein
VDVLDRLGFVFDDGAGPRPTRRVR